MGNLSDRQLLLLEKLKSEQSLTIEQIQHHFDLSPATVYRDFKALIQNGDAVKSNHGIHLALPVVPAAPVNDSNCAFCGGSLNERSSFIIQLKDGSQRKACCAHCGLMALGSSDTAAALTCDFLYGRMVNARQAAFLLESSVSLCCQPSVLSFANREDAKSFQAGFGGLVCSLDEAVQNLEKMMTM